MKKQTVKKRIFVSNTCMVLTTLVIFLIINTIVMGGYWEYVEQEMNNSMEFTVNGEELEEIVAEFTLRRNEFLLLFLADGILCIAVLVGVSQLFTKNLAEHMMEPLNVLAEGAERIRRKDLSQDVLYTGDVEFETVCHTFNDMRGAILSEQEKNRKYEKARTDMVAGISHDLRTPLTAVRGTIKGLLDGVAATPEQRQRFLETAYRRTEDMEALLNQLLYLSRLETGNLPLNLQTVEISGFIKNYIDGRQKLLENGPVEFAADIKGAAGYVSVDPEQLQRIFDNLLENSRKYGGVTPLKVRIDLNRADGDFHICFSDNGVGVPEEKLPYIFDEFYRVDESRNRKDGNGLGLYIVKYLTEAMGGSVRAENAGGFAVYIKLRKEER